MRQGTIVSALVTFAVGLFLVIQAGELPAGFSGTLGADVFPRWLGIGIMALSLIQIIFEFFPKLRSQGGIAWPEAKWGKQVIYVALAIIVYLAALDFLGFSLGTFLLTVFLIRILGQYKWLTILGVSLLSTALCTTVFKIWLDVQLPGGLLGL